MSAASPVIGGVEPEHAGSTFALLQTTQQLGSAIGLAVVVSVNAAGSVPGVFVPGLHAAFLTTTGVTLIAFLVAVVVLCPSRNRTSANA